MAKLIDENGVVLCVAPINQLQQIMSENNLVGNIEMDANEIQILIRSNIEKNAGDFSSLLGTTSDAVQFLLVEIAKLSGALAVATTFAEVRAAVEPLNTLLESFATNIANGTAKMPYQIKGGFSAIQSDIEQRGTTVSDVLIEASNA